MVGATRFSACCFFDQTRVTRRLDIATPTPSPTFSRSRYRRNSRRVGNHARISRGQSSSPREPSLRHAFCSMVHDLQTKTPVHKCVCGYQRKVASAALFSFAQLGKNLSLFGKRSLSAQDRLKARLFSPRAQPRAKKVFQFSNGIQRVSMRLRVLRAPLHPVLLDAANENVVKQVESVGDRGLYISRRHHNLRPVAPLLAPRAPSGIERLRSQWSDHQFSQVRARTIPSYRRPRLRCGFHKRRTIGSRLQARATGRKQEKFWFHPS